MTANIGKMIRQPAVAGYFYPAGKEELKRTIGSFQKDSTSLIKARPAKGAVLPHAGYVYSGKVAAQTVFSSRFQNTFIILGPNHTGLGKAYSIMTEGSWQTPLGTVTIDTEIAKSLLNGSRYFAHDTLAHQSEHSIEVIIPFLQTVYSEFKIVPIVISHSPGNIYKEIGSEIADVIAKNHWQNRISILASSDMTHYEPHESAKRKDFLAIESMIQLDSESLLKKVKEHDITMCGVGPVVITLEALKAEGAKQADLIKYQTSGDVTGDRSSVVGYAGLRIS